MEEIELLYWKIVTQSDPEVVVDYGNDIDSAQAGSGFSITDPLTAEGMDRWNLNVLPNLPGSLLRHSSKTITGVTVPWVYIGMLFASFCWHVEDDSFFSVNYSHFGATKTWYGTNAEHADKLETVMRDSLPKLFDAEPDLMMKLVTMISPAILVANQVPICRAYQNSGEFIVTWPKAYHCGFSNGFNCGEAVNFALESWLPFGREAVSRYRKFKRGGVVSLDRLVLTLVTNEPDEYSHDSLIKEMSVLIRNERRLQDQLSTLGVVCRERNSTKKQSWPLFPVPLWHSQVNELDRCAECNNYVFISHIFCPCSPQRVLCLLHHRFLCHPYPHATISYRYSVKELTHLAARIPMDSSKRLRQDAMWSSIVTDLVSSPPAPLPAGIKVKTKTEVVYQRRSRMG